MIVAVVSDLLFESKIAGAARVAGVSLQVARTTPAVLAALAEPAVTALVVDLHLSSDDSLSLCRAARQARPLLPIIGFFSHVDAETRRAALEAGATQALPRARFFADTVAILSRLAQGAAAESAPPSSPAHPPLTQSPSHAPNREGTP